MNVYLTKHQIRIVMNAIDSELEVVDEKYVSIAPEITLELKSIREKMAYKLTQKERVR